MLRKDKTYFNFNFISMPGCCGIGIIYNVLFYRIEPGDTATKEEIYEEFFRKIIETGKRKGVGKLILTDVVPRVDRSGAVPPGRMSIYDFCFSNPNFLHGSHCINPIHGSIICTFECDITESMEAKEVWKKIKYTPTEMNFSSTDAVAPAGG